jgi:hypothetical protein
MISKKNIPSSQKINFIVTPFIALLFGCFFYFISLQIDEKVLYSEGLDLWFEADIPRVFSNMTNRWISHYRTSVHPLYSLVSFHITHAFSHVLGLNLVDSVQVVMATLAALWAGLLFLVLRGMGCQLLDSIIFTVLGGVSAASIFWFSVPETYAWGSLTFLIALGFVLLTQKRHFAWYWYSLISAITFSMTITNWMAGLLVSLTQHPGLAKIQQSVSQFLKKPRFRVSALDIWSTWKGFLGVNTAALALIFVLAVVQRRIFPSAALNFLSQQEELGYIGMENSGGPLRALMSLLMHTIVMPQIMITAEGKNDPDWPLMLTQLSNPGSGSIWGAAAVGLWLGLLVLGIWSFFKVKGHAKLRFVLGFTLLGQIALHLIYGDETFLYSLHILPLLLLTVAFVSLTSFRPFGLALAGVLILLVGLNNFHQFQVATGYFQQYGPPRQAVRVEMQKRPSDPWPRGVGHVVLGSPGSYEEEKAYHEPGGSFSPAANSFGISLWVVDSSGNPLATSDGIPLASLRQELVEGKGAGIPGVLTETEFYQALWQSESNNQWHLKLNPATTDEQSIALLIRSVGPAGGPIDGLEWDGQRLMIKQNRSDLCTIARRNQDRVSQHPLLSDISHYSLADRCSEPNTEQLEWRLQVSPPPQFVAVGHEGENGWKTASAPNSRWEGEDGWGFARLDMEMADEITLTVERVNPKSMQLLTQTPTPFRLSLPDQQFMDSLAAQIAHLEMGLVENQPRPGEPLNYPLPWQRDGAYKIVALARAGQVDIAKQLALYFAEHDFFGGFGPEADAPGLSLWAIEQVAQQIQDPAFDQQVWPHVKRKAEWIERMLSTTESIHVPVSAPVIPSAELDSDVTLVADPSRDGLIVGRMDHHRPLLFVNAVSYRGLLDASELAGRLGYTPEQTRWQEQAAQLQQAWSRAFQGSEAQNERTYIASLWPTWIASNDLEPYQKQLASRREQRQSIKENSVYEPLWTYFDIAEAHQWLYLQETQPIWDTLEWFWQHQASPGLYTWWEGDGEENSSNFWKYIRGWIEPPHVTPHYWTASEMLLLQLDMLAYVDETSSTPEIVVAGGIPSQWFEQPMAVENLPIAGRFVSWYWDGEAFQVEIEGAPINVRLGSNIPAAMVLKQDAQ